MKVKLRTLRNKKIIKISEIGGGWGDKIVLRAVLVTPAAKNAYQLYPPKTRNIFISTEIETLNWLFVMYNQ